MKSILRNHGLGIRFVLMLLLCSIMLCFFSDCWGIKEVKAESAYSSSQDEDEEESQVLKNVKSFTENHQGLLLIIVLICTVINWKIWNRLVDIEFFYSIMDHYVKKALICFFIGGIEASIIILILCFIWEIIKKIFFICLFIIAIIGVIAIIYKYWDKIKTMAGGLADRKDDFQEDILPERQENVREVMQGENIAGSSKKALVAAGEKPMAKCEDCGEEIEIDAKFCCFCGKKLY